MFEFAVPSVVNVIGHRKSNSKTEGGPDALDDA